MARISGKLQAATDDLESLGGSVPSGPEAGDMSAAISSMLAGLVGAAAEISDGSARAADAVRRGEESYESTDVATGQLLQGLLGPNWVQR